MAAPGPPIRHRALAVAKSPVTFLALAVCIGVAMRVVAFANDRSLWLDEAFIGLNLMGRSYAGVLHTLNFGQEAPQGFLLASKLSIDIFGTSGYAFRAVSSVSSLLALGAFVVLARRLLPRRAAPVAVLLFALSDPLLRYSSELKPYQTDVAVLILLWLFVLKYLAPPRTPTGRLFALFAVLGPLAVFFSLPALFVLAGAALTLGVGWIRGRRWTLVRQLALVGVFWLGCFVVYYTQILRGQTHNKGNVAFFSSDFLPFPPKSLSDLDWLPRHLLLLFSNPPGFAFGEPSSLRHLLTGLAALTFIAGCISLYSRNKTAVGLVLSTLALTLAASAMQSYPFAGRLLLFTVPVLALVLAEGLWSVARRPHPAALALTAVLAVALFANPVIEAVRHLGNPWTVEETKPAMSYLRDHERPGDRIYLFYWSQYAFKIYARQYGFASALKDSPKLVAAGGDVLKSQPPSFIVGSFSTSGHHQGFERDIGALRGGGRTWVLFTHLGEGDSLDSYLSVLDRAGRRLDTFTAHHAELYLYDFG